MKANPGGNLAIVDIVGRDHLIKTLREQSETQSLILVAERRMGKTHVLKKLREESPPASIMLFRDIEGLRSAAEFVQYVVADLHPHMDRSRQFRAWVNTMVSQAGGGQIGPLKLPDFQAKHWKQVLQDAVIYVQSAEHISQVVFLWDELPLMLQHIAITNPHEAMELLDVLRSLRQNNDKLRMIFTGSIGLHHIIRQLKTQGYNNDPVNDMASIEVPPLDQPDAQALACKLLDGIGINQHNSNLAKLIAWEVDAVPYYIHHVVSELSRRTNPSALPTEDHIKHIVRGAIQSPHDTWHLKHYEDRTLDYYGTQRDACLTLLDGIASAGEPMSVQTAINGGKTSYPHVPQNEWLELIRLLERDYYLIRDQQTGTLSFKFSVVRRWWQWHRLNMPIQSRNGVAL